MAEEDIAKPKPTPKPEPVAAPEPTVAEKARKDIAAAKTGFDPTRPFRYAKAFIGGTVHHALNNIAVWGQRGLKWGAIAGFAAYMAPATVAALGLGTTAATFAASVAGVAVGATAAPMLIPLLAMYAFGAAVTGMVLGGTKGLITGGRREVARLHRSEVYAEDLISRSKIQQTAPDNRADYRAQRRAQARRDAINAQWFEVRQNEVAQDTKTYWQDTVHNQAPSMGQGRGW